MKHLYTLLVFLLFPVCLLADPAQELNETLKTVNTLKEKQQFNEIISLMNNELSKGKLYLVYFDILGGAYAIKENNEEAYLAYLRGYLSNPNTDYARNKLHPKMKFIENRKETLNKDSWIYKYLYAKQEFDLNNFEEADKLINKLIEENKNLDVLCVMVKDIKYFKTISRDAKFVQTNIVEAESDFNRAISTLGDQCPEFVFYEFAELLFKAGKYEQAIQQYKISIDKNPQRRDNLLKHGVCELYTKDYLEAKSLLLKCVAKNPDYAEAHLYLGFAYWANKESDKAVKSFKDVLDLLQKTNPTLGEKARRAMEVVNKGDLFLTPSDMDKILETTNPNRKVKPN